MYLLLRRVFIGESLERRAQNQHRPIPTRLHFCISVYRCSPIPGPHGRTLWSQFKFSSVLRSETNRCSRPLLSVFRHQKSVTLHVCELCALLCTLAAGECRHWVCVRHVWFSGPGERLSLTVNWVLLQGTRADLWLPHILLSRISAQTWFIGPLTWYGEWTFGTELCCFNLLWLLKYFPTIWFLDLFILITWCGLANFDFTTSWKWHPQLPCRNSLCRPIVIVNVSTTS